MVRDPSIQTRQQEALERARRHWLRRHEEKLAPAAPTRPDITIAIAREAGALGTSVAHELGQRLGWPVYDHELLELIAKEMGLRVNLLETVDERRQNWLLEALETFSESPYVSENSFVRHLIQTLLSLASHGHCIIVGRGAAQLLPAETTLRVRLTGDLKDRIAHIAARYGLAGEEAARKTEEVDRDRVNFIKDHFHRDPTDLKQYDLVINTSRWGVTGSAELIIQALGQLLARGGADTSR